MPANISTVKSSNPNELLNNLLNNGLSIPSVTILWERLNFLDKLSRLTIKKIDRE